MTIRTQIDDLVREARAQTGLDDLGGDTWREGLEVLLRSAAKEARFGPVGEAMFHGAVLQPLVNRLQVEGWYAAHPEIDDQDVVVDLVGVGFPRTGSTALSHLLAEDDRFRILRLWEETTPCPPPGVSPEADAERLAVAEARVSQGLLATSDRLRSMLPQSATGPMEDHDLMAMEFKAQHFLVAAQVPSYADWFAHCDMEPTYRYERRVLKLLQWRTPQKRWRLKCPTHTMFLDTYERVFPGARFVQTHRDVGELLPSVSDLYVTLLRFGSPDIDPVYVGELNMAQWAIALDRCLAFRQDSSRDARFFDIGFRAFQADPVGEIAQLYEWLGDDLPADVLARMEGWRADNPRDKHGRHETDAAAFGLDGAAMASRFGAYRQRFAPVLA